MRRARPTAPAGLVALALLWLATACGVPDQGTSTVDAERVPDALRSTTSTSTTAPGTPTPVQVQLYWVADGMLAPEPVSFETPPSPSTLLTLLERGVPPGGVNQGLRSALSGTDAIRSASLEDDRAVVAVQSLLAELPESDQLLAVAQIVATLTSSPAIEEVVLEQDGEVLDVPLPDGSIVRRPLRREDYASLLP